MDLREVVHVLRKRWTWIAAAAVAGLSASALWTYTRTPLFEAVTQIEVIGSPTVGGDLPFPYADDERTGFETHRYLLTSRRVLEAASASIDLPGRLDGAGPDWLARRVTVERVPDTRIFRIAATAPDPGLARDIANALRDVYEQDDIGRRLAGAKKQLAWLEQQMGDVKGQVEQSELALIQYIETANLDLVDMPRGGDSEGNGSDLTPTGSGILASLEADLARKELALAQERLDRTDAHPGVVRAKQEMEILRTRIAAEKKRVAEENKKRIRYGMLRRDAELNRQLFHLLMKEVKETNLVGDEAQGRIEVLETAVANPSPVYPKPATNLPLGLAAGLLFGVGLVFLQESLDRTLKSREEVERALGLPVLGVVHRVGARRGGRSRGAPEERFLVRSDGGWSPELEDFRTLRTNLRFARPEGENRIVLVTSTAPQEGKTTIATNLAIVSAHAGEKVLLVDADLRRPAVHQALAIKNGVGLTNLLVERQGAPEGEALIPTAWPNLTVITAGAFAPNPPDLLESARCAELIAAWKKRYDRVIIDSPPQSSVIDPSILAPVVDGVLLVVSAGRIEAERARLSRRMLANAGARFYGAVVNHLSRSDDRYGYGYGYPYSYGRREEADEEPVTPLPGRDDVRSGPRASA